MDDHKLLQESNLTVRQSCKALITFYVQFNKRRSLAKEGRVNLAGATSIQLRSSRLFTIGILVIFIDLGLQLRRQVFCYQLKQKLKLPSNRRPNRDLQTSKRVSCTTDNKSRALAYSCALSRVRGVVQREVQGVSGPVPEDKMGQNGCQGRSFRVRVKRRRILWRRHVRTQLYSKDVVQLFRLGYSLCLGWRLVGQLIICEQKWFRIYVECGIRQKLNRPMNTYFIVLIIGIVE